MDERVIRIERAASGREVKTTKNEKLRAVRVLKPLADDLARWREKNPDAKDGTLLFRTSSGAMWSDTGWRNWHRRVFDPAAEAVGIDAPPYHLRHSFASLLLHEGKSSAYVARQIGDSIRVTLDTYTHVIDGLDLDELVTAVEAIEAARAEFDVRGEYAEGKVVGDGEGGKPASTLGADARTRTADPFITSEVLYQLSYVGAAASIAVPTAASGIRAPRRHTRPAGRCCDRACPERP